MLAQRTVGGTCAVDIPQLVSGDHALIDNTCRKNTTVAEVERPDVLLLVKIACEATRGDVYSAYVADPGRDPLLVGAFDPDVIPQSTAEFILGRRHGVPRRVEVVDFDAFRNQRLAAAEDEGRPITTIAAPAANSDCPVEGPPIRVDLDGHDHITARINRWPSEDRDASMPPFPAVDEVQLDLMTGCGTVQMGADQTRAVAAGFHRFADELTAMAAELDALGGQVMPVGNNTYSHPVPAPSWATETQSSGGMDLRHHWTAHYSDLARLAEPSPAGELLTEAQLFGFFEDGEPPQVFLRILGADDSSVENDLTAEQTDQLIASTEEFLTKLRGFRTQMEAN